MSSIKLRRATHEDMARIYEWRNAPSTQKYSFNAEPIPWDTHVNWFKDILFCDKRILLIGEILHHPIGVLRFNLLDSDEAVVDIYLVPGEYGKGLGSKLLLAGIQWARLNTTAKMIRAEIISDNIASLKAFAKVGFKEQHRVFKYNLR